VNLAQFRTDLRAWLDEHDLTPGPDHSLDGHMRQMARVSRALYDADWMRYGWPVEVGGLGDPAILRFAGADEKIRFTSSILPKWARRTKSLDALLPVLYLRGAHSRAAGRC